MHLCAKFHFSKLLEFVPFKNRSTAKKARTHVRAVIFKKVRKKEGQLIITLDHVIMVLSKAIKLNAVNLFSGQIALLLIVHFHDQWKTVI